MVGDAFKGGAVASPTLSATILFVQITGFADRNALIWCIRRIISKLAPVIISNLQFTCNTVAVGGGEVLAITAIVVVGSLVHVEEYFKSLKSQYVRI